MPKVASSSVSLAVLPYLQNRTVSRWKDYPFIQAEVWARAGHLQYDQFLAGRNSTPTFLIVRHPLTRIASAFRNKLEPGTRNGEYFIKEYAKIISSRARGSWTAGDPDPTFPEFVKYQVQDPIF